MDGLAANTPVVVLRADGSVIATLRTDANGEVVITGLPEGEYTVQSTDAQGNATVKMVRVLGVQLSTSPSELAFTGSTTASLIIAALGSIGFGFILLGRRRTTKRR